MIYAVQILDCEFVKIGFSSNEEAEARIAQLQTGCPFEIVKLFTITGTLRQEQTLHAMLDRMFMRLRIPVPPNEWYPGRSPDFKKFLDYLKYGFEPAVALLFDMDPTLHIGSTKKAHKKEWSKKWPKLGQKKIFF